MYTEKDKNKIPKFYSILENHNNLMFIVRILKLGT